MGFGPAVETVAPDFKSGQVHVGWGGWARVTHEALAF